MQQEEVNNDGLQRKVALADSNRATGRPFSLNSLRCYRSIERNVEIYSSDFAETLRTDFDKVISQCNPITRDTLKQKSGILNRLVNSISYQVIQVTLTFLTFLPHIRILKKYRL